MAKSVNSKIKRKHGAIRTEKYRPKALAKLKVLGSLQDPGVHKPWAVGFLKAAQAKAVAAEEQMDDGAFGMKPLGTGSDGTGDAKLSQTGLAVLSLMRTNPGAVTEEEAEAASAEAMSANFTTTQMNKLIKASKTQRHSKKKKNRRNITCNNALKHNKSRSHPSKANGAKRWGGNSKNVGRGA